MAHASGVDTLGAVESDLDHGPRPRTAYEGDSGLSASSGRERQFLRFLERVRRRLRLRQALLTGWQSLPGAVTGLSLVVVIIKLAGAPEWSAWAAVTLGFCVWGAMVARSFFRGPSLAAAAIQADAHYDQKGAIPAAWEVLKGRGARDGYGELLLDRLFRQLEFQGRPADVVRLETPRSAAIGLLMVCGLGFLLYLQPRTSPPPPPRSAASVPKPSESLLSNDDAELVRLQAQTLKEDMSSEAGREQAERFNEIVEQVVAGAISEEEAFRLLSDLEQELKKADAAKERFLEGLERRGEALAGRAVTDSAGRALKDRRVPDAEEALRQLAERLKEGTQPLSEKELEELREALTEARKVQEVESKKAESSKGADAERAELEEKRKRLLKKKNEGRASSGELSELEQTERRLKQLDRQKSADQQELSELDKQLAEAARELAREQKKAGEFMDQAAKSLSRGAKRQLSDQEKQKLIEQLKKLKERLRKQNQEGDQAKRMQKFQKRARGQKPDEEGSGEQSGQPQPGPGGAPMPVPIPAPGQGSEPGSEGEGSEPASGREPGQAHDPTVEGQASESLEAQVEDKAAAARDTGEGQSASETILTAAERGFSSASYQRLYRDYETVAEEVMQSEDVPPGHKRHVQRYFELIRPRASQDRTGK